MLLLERILHASQIRKHLGVIGKLLFLVAYLFDAFFKVAYKIPPTIVDWNNLEYIEGRVFFMVFSIGIALIALQKIDTVFEFWFMEWAVWNVLDEIAGNGSTFQWYEIVIAFASLLIAYLKFSGLGSHFIKIWWWR